MKKILAIGILGIFLAACGEKEIEVVTTPAKIPPVVAPTAAAMTLRDVNWMVLNRTNLEQLLKQLNANPDPNFVIYALTNQGYENTSLNMQEIKRYILEQQSIIKFYERLEEARANQSVTKPEEPKK